MNIMYLKLKQGEETAPLRDMALKNFPDVNLQETDVYADEFDKKDVLNHIISGIKEGKYDKLYIKSLRVFSPKILDTYNILSNMAEKRPDFEIESKTDGCFKLKDFSNRLNRMLINFIHDSGITKDLSDPINIKHFNDENAPFEIIDHEDYYTLGFAFTTYADFCRNAFNNYSKKHDTAACDTGTGLDWEKLFKEVFKDDNRLDTIRFNSDLDSFFCHCEDLATLESMCVEFRQVCKDEEQFEVLVENVLTTEDIAEKQDMSGMQGI